MSRLRMSIPGSSRPPMSRVSATPWPAFGTVVKVCWAPAATRFPARQPVATGSARRSARSWAGASRPGRPRRSGSSPPRACPGWSASDGYVAPFQACSCARSCPRPGRWTRACRPRARCRSSRRPAPTAIGTRDRARLGDPGLAGVLSATARLALALAAGRGAGGGRAGGHQEEDRQAGGEASRGHRDQLGW